MANVDPRILEMLDTMGKRPKTVVEHIIQHGEISTYEIENKYGYNHGPRAIRDVKELGIPIKKKMIKNENTGRKMAVYSFGDFKDLRNDLLKGRKNFPQKFKDNLFNHYNYKCGICNGSYTSRDLQVDHRIPYEVTGDQDNAFTLNIDDYMPLCPSDNRKKSFTCENCTNWNNERNPNICKTCYWAYPENYNHIATNYERRVEMVFQDNDINLYESLKREARIAEEEMEDYIINKLKNS